MKDKFFALRLPPGLYRNGTKYEAKGRWYDANLIRFFERTIRPIGGWRVARDTAGGALNGVGAGAVRHALGWIATGGVRRLVVATVTGSGSAFELTAVVNGTAYDITPSGITNGTINTSSSVGAGEYGDADYGEGIYGGGGLSLTEGDVWHLDTFGDYLVACRPSDGKIHIWGGNTSNRAVPLNTTTFPGTTDGDHPINNFGVVVTPERFLVALGADGDARKIKWADQESFTVWTPDTTNQAGDFILTTNGRIRCGRRTKGQTLIWTDTDMHSMNYIGGTLVYSIRMEGENCGIIGPNALAMADTQAFWMGLDGFFTFDGFVKPVPCDVYDAVFGDLNKTQAQKIVGVSNSTFSEVTFFYPSAAANENDRYVTFNYREGHWTTGRLARSAAIDRGPFEYPIWVSEAGIVYEHEFGTDRGNEQPYLESGPIEIGDGDRVMGVMRLIPDENTLGNVRLYLYTAFWPTDTEVMNGPFTVAQPTDVRYTARQVRVRLEQDVGALDEVDWRFGVLRLGVNQKGTR
jgi:hypothetical protein